MFGTRKKVMCDVCGLEMIPKREKTIQINGGIVGFMHSPECYDVMDCPECGCQIVLKKRNVIEYRLNDDNNESQEGEDDE